ncbi:MAG: sodium-dependent transporter [Lachnospiraceae bacterium]|jgi:NSS family neurotransmitter:Na+ symporter|nr:sodium-dependent transporter [Lachnospiraceae bacterium]
MGEKVKKEKGRFSRFGYIMVAAGAAIGLGNIWRFPPLAYENGGGVFVIVYIIIAYLLGHSVVEMESALGRHTRVNAVDAYGKISKKWKFAGAINVICTVLIDMYYIIVSGYVLKYAIDFLVNFKTISTFEQGTDQAYNYYVNFISNPWQPLVYSVILMIIIVVLLGFGITELVEKVTKVILPALMVLLLICGIWALFISPGAIDGLKTYILPTAENWKVFTTNPETGAFTLKPFSNACVQIMFSVGIGWAIFTTLGTSIKDSANIRKDSAWVTFLDTGIAILAGFVIVPSVIGGGSTMKYGPSLIFQAMTEIFAKFPGGQFIGFFFFLAIIFAVLSTYFTILEIPVKVVEEKFKMSHLKATIITAIVILIGGVFCSLSQGSGLLSNVLLPWPSVSGIAMYNIYDWIDCFSAYVLLPLGCLLTSFFITFKWGFKGYAAELLKDGRDGKFTTWNKIVASIIVPILTIIVILNVFGFLK